MIHRQLKKIYVKKARYMISTNIDALLVVRRIFARAENFNSKSILPIVTCKHSLRVTIYKNAKNQRRAGNTPSFLQAAEHKLGFLGLLFKKRKYKISQ